ncbi:hypothetical protein H261_21863 [Paramagnetospirillum caucaseum]|uniref:Uncharacterized protein n=1 Tax=Paramagnetospirillum caucaseum TaxID=1244869 RepID=M2ZKD3_9PROT|nr:hypothetical protein [Paramagnetospirillum caucaseum]EME67762.1 hypothetical protein H261_21863 [Paramagnetospirillum caucaseum]
MQYNAQALDHVVEAVMGALSYLKAQRDARGGWEDPANMVERGADGAPVPGKGDIIVCEGLLSYLIAWNRFGTKPDLARRLDEIYPRPLLEQDVYDLLERMGNDRQYSGTPYVSIVDGRGQSHPFLDTVCYAVSLVVLSEAVFGAPSSEPRLRVGRGIMEDCLDILARAVVADEVGRAKGWSFTNHDVPDRPFKYFTWMACDTLSDLCEMKDFSRRYFATPRVVEGLATLRRALSTVKTELVRIHILGQHSAEEKQAFGGRNVDIRTGKAVQEDEFDQGFSFNLWVIMALLYLDYEEPARLKEALFRLGETLENPKVKSDQIKNGCLILLETASAFKPGQDGGENQLLDRSFLPQYVKALALLGLWHPDLAGDLRPRLDQALEWLLANRAAKCPAWDKYAQKGDFAVYQTERAIEALCRVAEWLEDGLPAPDVPAPEAHQAAAGGISVTELAKIVADVTARHAVSIEINGERARAMIERFVRQSFEDLRLEMSQQLKAEVSRVLGRFEPVFSGLAERLETASSGQASAEEVRRAAEDIRALMLAEFAGSER